MRIGIDARFLTHPQRGGFKTYTHTVVSALIESGSDHEFVMYTDRPGVQLDHLPANCDVRAITGVNSIIREQIALPMAMKRDHIDAAHFLSNTGPVLMRPNMAVTIHDTIPLREEAGTDHQQSSRKQCLFRTYWRGLIPRAARAADLVIADSAYVRDDLAQRLGVSKDRIRVVPIAINPVFFADLPGTPPVGVDAESPFLIAFGNADGRKNHRSALQAFNTIVSGFPGLKLVLICSHPGVRETLLADDNIIPVGPVSSDELLWLYRNARALVFPSFDEGFGLPPVEAMACGTPVIVSKAGSLPEVVGPNGVFINPHDIDDIAQAMKYLLSDKDLQQRLSVSGREHAAQYDLKRMGKDLISVYQEVADQGRRMQ